MKWYKKLYLGDNAKESRMHIMEYTVLRKFQPDVYLIVLPSNNDNLLEMFRATELKQPHYHNKHIWKNIYVVGIAKGYDEAVGVMEQILTEVYHNTGGFKVREYLGFGIGI